MSSRIANPARRGRVSIIRRKVAVPPSADHSVSRPRLDDLITELLNRNRVVIVSATAGAGKTTAVSAVAQLRSAPVAWLSVDTTDRAPGRLVTYLESALAEVLPELTGVATDALAAGLPHAEAAGLLAEAIGTRGVLLVIDDLERLGDARAAWTVIEAVIRYSSPEVRIALLSREDVSARLTTLPRGLLLASTDENDLAFTPAEASEALAKFGAVGIDPHEAVAATGGWVTGVLFEAWRSMDHVVGAGGEADPLHGYLSSHILTRLPPVAQDFLVETSLLDDVTTSAAEALGREDAAETLAQLRMAHLPVTWAERGRVMRCHPRFREYLIELFERRRRSHVREIRCRYGALLAGEDHHEEATEAFLKAGAPDEALASAENAIMDVLERFDLSIADRWLKALAPAIPTGGHQLTVAKIMLAIARDDYSRAVHIADELQRAGERTELIQASARAAALMSWAYLHAGRLDDASIVLDLADPDPSVDAARAAVLMADDKGADIPIPELTGGPLDVMVLRIAYLFGQLDVLRDAPRSRWVDAVAAPWRIASLRATGHTQEALDLYLSAKARGTSSVALHAYIGPETLMDAGLLAEARTATDEGRHLARGSGSLGFTMFNAFADVKLRLRLEHDHDGAQTVLDRAEQELGAHRFPFAHEQLDTWYGLKLLLEARDAEALARLRRAVESMRRGGRIIELVAAAVYLAEAEWRAGEETRADAAADLALLTAQQQRSNHLLLQALTDFPAVVSRRLDAELRADSPWHDIGRALRAQGITLRPASRTRVTVCDFGPPAVLVDGEPAKMRLGKTSELLAFLCINRSTTRSQLLDALFAGRTDTSTRAYLRQAIHQVKQLLPEESALVVSGQTVRLGEGIIISSESETFETMLAQAARRQGQERLDETLTALALADEGEFLATSDSAWVEERRQYLAVLVNNGRHAAAELAFSLGRVKHAEKLTALALRADPLNEAGWRLMMRIANSLGDEDGVIRAFQSCERALAELPTRPSGSTRQLLETLRR